MGARRVKRSPRDRQFLDAEDFLLVLVSQFVSGNRQR
jgi:hypothetical protein